MKLLKNFLRLFAVVMALCITCISVYANLAGDIDGNGSVDLDDAILLLQHSMFPDDFNVDYDMDMDFVSDGSLNLEDAIYLLQHSMFPDSFPIDTVPVRETLEDAYVLTYNKAMRSHKEGINSGWVLDNRGGTPRTGNNGFSSIGDVSEKYATAYIREFNLIDSGRIVTELSLYATADGSFVEFRDKDESSTYMLKIVDGMWCVLDENGEYVPLADVNERTLFRIVTDLDKGVGSVYIDNVSFDEIQLLSDNVLSLRVGIDEINCVVNYAAYETFDLFGIDSVYDWKITGASVSNGELCLSDGASAYKTFTPVRGTVTAETYFIAEIGSDFCITISNVLDIESKDGMLTAGGDELYKLTPNMWYRLRVDVNTAEGYADIWLNGRIVSNVELDRMTSVSGFRVESSGNMRIDNVKVYGTVEHDDYVPEPEQYANLDDYIVAVNVCSLWRNGTHYGWSCITPYDEAKPVIGYYDEGVPETADWEIKYMVDHGIDVQAFCWYGDVSSGPLKRPEWGDQLHEGYMYAKYSDYMKYVIQFETSASKSFNSKQFRNYVVPFWFENYFLDDRYLKIDDKIVLPIYNFERLATSSYFGSAEKLVEELGYLEVTAREYGFDGVIILACGTPTDSLEKIGVDGTYAYSWGAEGRKKSVNINSIKNASNNSDSVYAIPTVSVGFDSIPWHHLRNGMISTEDYRDVLEWVRDDHLPSIDDIPSWAENLVWISTWNEFGEGTYVFPAGQNDDGFGYLNSLRSVFTDLDEEHEDVVPTPAQLERVTHLYPQYARLLRREGWYEYDSDLYTAINEPKNKLFINGIDILANTTEEFHIPPKKDGRGRIYFPFNPSTGVNYVLGCHYEWRKDNSTLRILANGHEVVFEADCDVYKVDGKEKFLGYTVELIDGIPLINFVKLASDLGYECEEKDGNVYIYTDTYEDVWVDYNERTTGVWEFNNYGSDCWDSDNMTLTTDGEVLKMTTNQKTNDPQIYFIGNDFPEDFYTQRYTQIKLRAKYNMKASGQRLVLHYITENDTTWTSSKSFTYYIGSSTANFKEITINLSNNTVWNSSERITGLRLDPFGCEGTFELDYIRFEENPDFEFPEPEPEDKEFAIENGDAEDTANIPFYSGNTYISITEDPEDESNHAYLVRAHPGNTYAYFRYPGKFEPGVTYKVEFDIKLVGNNINDESFDSTSFCSNFRYQDKINGVEHVTRTDKIKMSDGWVHYSATHKISSIKSNKGAEFTIYVNPQNGVGFNYMIDNVKVVKQ